MGLSHQPLSLSSIVRDLPETTPSSSPARLSGTYLAKVNPRSDDIDWLSWFVEMSVIAIAYFALARLGQILAIEPKNVTPVWPASGLAFYVVLTRGNRVWPGLWLGNFLGNTWAFLSTASAADFARTALTGIAIGPGDVAQAIVGVYLYRRFCNANAHFSRVSDVFYFVACQIIACTLSATGGVLALWMGGITAAADVPYTWATWYLGDGVGIILLAPFLMTWESSKKILGNPRRTAEATFVLLLGLATSYFLFFDVMPGPLSFLTLPLVLWAAVRGNIHAVSTTVLVIAIVAIAGTHQGTGPFSGLSTESAMLALQAYSATSAITGLSVGASLAERRYVERQLSRTGARLDQALSGGNVGLWDWDVPTNSVYYSAQFKIQLGYGPEEDWNSYREWEERLHPEDKENAVQCVRDYLEGRTTEYVSTFRLRHKNGNYIWILSRGEATWDDQGNPRRIIGVHVDITIDRLRSQQLERANLELQQMNYAASHDLKEPLRSISNFSQLVETTYHDKLDGDGRSWLEAIVRNTKRMQALLTDLGTYTALDDPSHSFESVELNGLLADALSNLDNLIKESQATISHDDLPLVTGNPSQLVQLFQNLIGNAIHYRSEATPQVHVSATRGEDYWTIAVKDNGIGIEASQHEAIFELFRRLRRDQQPGTGIGLAICRRVVQRHHGSIWVQSELHGGSTFYFTIPLEQGVVN